MSRGVFGKGWTAARISVATVIALVLVLGLSVSAVGCGGGGGPEAAVDQFLTAIAEQDVDALVDVMLPPEELSMLEEMAEDMDLTLDEAKNEMVGDIFSGLAMFEELSFSDLTMVSQVDGDEAEVTITGGSMNVVMGGLSTTLDLSDVGDMGFPTEFGVYKVDGKWYIDYESMGE